MSTDSDQLDNNNPEPTGNPSADATKAADETLAGTDETTTPPPSNQSASTDSAPSAPAPADTDTDTPASKESDSVPAPQPANTSADRPKIAIGSQRDVAEKTMAPKAVELAVENPVQLVSQEAVEVPSEPEIEIKSLEGLGGDLESEIEAALGGMSMDDIVSGTEASSETLEPGSRVKGTVTKTHGDNVFLSFKGRFEGIVSLSQFKKPPADGDLIEIIVKGHNEEDGLYELSVPGAAVSVGDWSELEQGMIIEARVTGSNTGGLEASVNNIRGFIPASQIERFRVENFGDYVNKKLQCVVTEVNPQKKRLVLSHRALLDREYEEKRKEMMATLEVGQLHDGTVTKIMDFGAFVDIGGIEGLVHVSKLSWDRVTHPKDVLKEGESIKVKVEKIQADTGKISLSHRDTMDHPWDGIESKYPVNSTVSGKVSRIADFGAFVRLEPGIEGLIHISELAHHRVVKVKNIVKEGDSVEVKVLSLDRDAQKLGLSLKATQKPPERKNAEKPEEVDEPLRDLAVKKQTDAPLKGGTGRKSGGEDFGLTLG